MASPGSQAASRSDQGSRGQSKSGKSSGSSGGGPTISHGVAPGPTSNQTSTVGQNQVSNNSISRGSSDDAAMRALIGAMTGGSTTAPQGGSINPDDPQTWKNGPVVTSGTPGLPGSDPLKDQFNMADAWDVLSHIPGPTSALGTMSALAGDMSGISTNPFGPTSPVTGSSYYNGRGMAMNAKGDVINPQTGQVLYNASQQPATNPSDPSNLTLDHLYDQIGGVTNASDLYYLQQRGLVPMDATSIPDQWSPVFQREFDRVKAGVPTSATSTATNGAFGNQADYNSALQSISALFPGTFGDQALSAEEQRRQNAAHTSVAGLGLENEVSQNFGDTSDDAILQDIYNKMYDPASTQLMNALKRGALNPAGYQYGMNKLDDQGKAGMAKLQQSGSDIRSSLSGGLNDDITSIYDKASKYKLGDPDFDASQFTGEFNNQLDSAKNQLSGQLNDIDLPNIFDVGSVLQGAGTVQGTTSRGGLLDTLAARNYQKRNTSRGVGSTGAF